MTGLGMARVLPAPNQTNDCGNSGTTIRLLAGALSPAGFRTSLTGDASLQRRPMGRLIDPLAALGADVVLSDGGTAPLEVGGSGDRLRGADVVIPMASAQVRSAFELAAIQAVGGSSVKSPPGSGSKSTTSGLPSTTSPRPGWS